VLDPAVSVHRDVHQLVRNGTLGNCSFEFSCDPNGDDWSEDYDETTGQRIALRTVRSARLHSVSLVNRPAYGDGATYAEARSRLSQWLETGRRPLTDAELRRAVREIGIQMKADAAEYGFMEVRDANGKVTFEPITRELMEAIALARGREIEAELAVQQRVDANEELAKRFEDKSQARLDPQNPYWGPRSA
jgi:hypothetical protein